MTLKELIAKVCFDDLLPYLMRHEEDHLDNIYAFREAYDILRNMEPAPEYHGEIHVILIAGEYDDEEKYVRVCYMDDADWDEDLAKDIVVDKDVNPNLAKLAMYCLWEITYDGFSPEERNETWKRILEPKKLINLYEVALDKLEESIWQHQIPRKQRSKDPNGRRYVSSDFVLKRCAKNNRSKRKRKYRQSKREKYLKAMAKRENLVRMLCAEGSDFRHRDVEFLMDVKYVCRYNYRSVTRGTDGRLSYIAESIAKYQQLDWGLYDSAVVFLRIPKPYPTTGKEIREFQQVVQTVLGYEDILFGGIEEVRNTKEVMATLLLNKCK